MKWFYLSALFLLLCCHVIAEDMNPQIQVPDPEIMLIPARPSGMQKESLPLIEETRTVMEYFKYINKGEYEEALAYIRKSDEYALGLIESGDPEGELKKHASEGGVSLPDRAGSLLRPGERVYNISSYLLYLIGHNYYSLERYKEAEIAFLAALAPLPDFTSVHVSLGQVYLMMERYEDACKHLVHAAELGQHTAGLFGALGHINFKKENFPGAEKAFRKAMLYDPDFKQSKQWELGLLYSLLRTNQHRSALTLAEHLLKEHPDDAGFWLYRANAAYYSGEREIALSSLETAMRLGDQRVSNMQVCATLHMELGSMERAVELLKTGFSRGMDFRYIDQGMSRLEQAEEWGLLEQMTIEIRGKWDILEKLQQSKVLMREADISLHKGDMSAASDTLEKAIKLDPSNAYAMMSLAGIYRENGNYNKAELLYQRAGAHDLSRENALISLAQLAIYQEDYTHALKILRDMLKEFPGRTDLNRNIESLEKMIMRVNPYFSKD